MSIGSDAIRHPPHLQIKKSLRTALYVLLFLVVGMGGFAAFTSMRGAVIGPGQVVVGSDVKKVQHPTGGVVAEIRVKDGSHVRAGDILLTLDPKVPSSSVAIFTTSYDQLMARQARLEAERDSRGIRFPAELTARGADPALGSILADETRLYHLHVDTREGQKAQLRQRQDQLQQQILGYQQETDARKKEIVLIEQELVGVRKLYAQQLIPLTRLNTLERTAIELHGDVAQFATQIAEARGKISEIALQIIQTDQEGRSQAGAELTDVQNRLTEIKQRKVSAEQDFSRIVIRATQDGVVDKLNVHTIGGVIGPGEPIMFIVPDKDSLHVEMKLRPNDIDQVHSGQTATLRFSAFNSRTTPELRGTVEKVSAETHTDDRTGAQYYVATVDINAGETKKLGGLQLVPGMPVESFIQTEPRSMLSYLTRPLTNQFRRAFRES